MPIFCKNRELLEQFRRGERNALAAVYRFYFTDVYRLGQYGFWCGGGVRAPSLSREADRLDFTQEVFVKAFSPAARNGYDGVRPYRPFLLQLARNLRVDQLRRAARDPNRDERCLDHAIDLDQMIEKNTPFPDPAAPDADLHWERMLQKTASIVSTFESEIQQIARLRFMQELSQAEVAERLGLTRRRVRTLEARLLARLRRHLARAGLGPDEK